MKKLILLLPALVLANCLLTSCDKTTDPIIPKQSQAVKEETKQQTTTLKKEVKEADEGPIEVVNSPLTEAEQKAFGSGAKATSIEDETRAINFLKLLLKGSPKTIRWYQQAIKENHYTQKVAQEWYEGDIEVAVSSINTRTNEEGFKLVADVLKTKKEYPKAMAKAASAMKYSQNTSIIPLLRDVAKYPDSNVRSEAAGSLLYLGDADAALPILEELVEKEGSTTALRYLFRDKGKIIDERGFKIVEKALTNKNAVVRISAANILLEAKKLDRSKMEEIALTILEALKDRKKSSYGIGGRIPHKQSYPAETEWFVIPEYVGKTVNELEKPYHEDSVACEYAIPILGTLRSKKAVPALMYIKKHNIEKIEYGSVYVGYVCSEGGARLNVTRALENILRSGERK